MFLGTFFHTLDKKGRLFIPSKFRTQLERGFVLAKGINEKCLFLFTYEEFSALEEKIKALPLSRKKVQEYARWISSSASEEFMDQQGRVTIPLTLRNYAELEKEVTVVGVWGRIEIWSKKYWDRFFKKADKEFLEITKDIEDLGF
ncbi:Transcriptional regulator MraZ [subsurface metagenome]